MSERPIGPPLRRAPPTETRASRLGASEVAAVLGLSRFKTPLDVWESKTGRHHPDEGDDVATRSGRRREPMLIQWLAEEVGALRYVAGDPFDAPFVVGQAPHIGAHPDVYLDTAHGWENGETKTASLAEEWGDGPDEMPDDYFLQVQVQLYCTGLAVGRLGAEVPVRAGRRTFLAFRVYRLEADVELHARIVERCERWWERHVVADTPPPAVDLEEQARVLAHLYPRERTGMRAATAEEALAVRELVEARKAAKAAEKRVEDASVAVKTAIGNGAGLLIPGGKATWTAQSSDRIDVTRLRAELPDVAARFTTPTASRVLRASFKE